MDVKHTQLDQILGLEPHGALDTRGALEFERAVGPLLPKTRPLVIVDATHLETLTGAGIRVLVTLSNRIAHLDGQLRLCALTDGLHKVFAVAGLADHFTIVPTFLNAVSDLSSLTQPDMPAFVDPVMRALATRVHTALGGTPEPVEPPAPAVRTASPHTTATLAAHIDDLLAGR